MCFPTSLRMIQLTFLFHDELKCAMGRLKEITVDSDIDFSLRKIVIGEVIGKKNMFNRWGHQKHNEKMWPLKKMLHSELKRKINNTSHVFFVSFSKGSSNTLLRFAESQWGEKLFGLADNNFNCYQTVLECLGIVSYKTDYFNAREIMGQNPSFALLVSRPYPFSICIIQRDGVHYNVSLATRSSFM